MMIKKNAIIFMLACLAFVLFGCNTTTTTAGLAGANPKNDVYYEIFVRSFADSDADGVGDFNGITAKLDYLTDLGITGIWLMPIHPSPSYHGYDVTDYYAVNPDYGTMADFENLVTEASAHGIRVMLDMVFNHTSSQHPWFQAALAGDAQYLAFYNFIDGSTDTSGALGSWGQNIWHTVGDAKFCGYFSNTMPDLNFTNPAVLSEIMAISKFWVDKGVTGFRLDAAHHFFGTNEYLDRNVTYLDNLVYLRDYTDELEAYAPNFYVLGEIMIEDLFGVVAKYFMSIDSPIDFPVAAILRSSAPRNTNRAYVSMLKEIYDEYRDNSADFISAPFLTNHDMDRMASQVSGNQDTLRLAAEMLLTLPGNPILYYGEEIGMYGEKTYGPDIWDETRRMPLPWGDASTTDWLDDSSTIFINVDAQNKAIANVSEQVIDGASLFSVYQQLLLVRDTNIALKYGNSFAAYEHNTDALQGFYREYTFEDQTQKVLILHNFSVSVTAAIEIVGTVLYCSETTDLTNVTGVPPKSTVIIDVTGVN
jgi:alpha-amylase